jgi:hypothetical protein
VFVNPTLRDSMRESVAAVLNAMSTDQFLLNLFENSPGLHADSPTLWLPARSGLYDSPAIRDSPVGRYIETLVTAGTHGLAVPLTRAWRDEEPAINSAVSSVLTGARQPKPALRTLRRRLSKIEQTYQRK